MAEDVERTTQEPKWGIRPPRGYEGAAWGARALFEPDGRGGLVVSLLADRQGCSGGTAQDQEALQQWVQDVGLPWAKAWAPKLFDVNERREYRHEQDGYVLVMNPKQSYGYLYLGAWRLPPVAS